MVANSNDQSLLNSDGLGLVIHNANSGGDAQQLNSEQVSQVDRQSRLALQGTAQMRAAGANLNGQYDPGYARDVASAYGAEPSPSEGLKFFSDLRTGVIASGGFGPAATASLSTQRITGGTGPDTFTFTPMVGEGGFTGPGVDFSLVSNGEVAPTHYAVSGELDVIAGVSLNLTFDHSGNFDLRLGGQIGLGEFAGAKFGPINPQAGAEHQWIINEQNSPQRKNEE